LKGKTGNHFKGQRTGFAEVGSNVHGSQKQGSPQNRALRSVCNEHDSVGLQTSFPILMKIRKAGVAAR